MAKNITLMGANYPDVPAVRLPKTGGGTAQFIDADDIQAEIGDLANLSTTAKNNLVAAINEARLTASIKSYTFLDSDSTHYVSVSAHGYHDEIIDFKTITGVAPQQLTGFTILCDRTPEFIVTIVSQSGNTLTFRWYNTADTAKTIGGIVGIFRYLTMYS